MISNQVPASRITMMTGYLGMGTILVCYMLCVYVTKTIPPLPHIPMISDTFVPFPADIISRIGMIGTAFGLWAIQRVFIFYSDVASEGRTKCDKLYAWLGSLGAFGLMLVAACNEREDMTIHGTGAGIFFVGQLIMMIGFTIRAFRLSHISGSDTTRADARFKLWTTTIAALAGIGFLIWGSNYGKNEPKIAICEWLAVLMIMLFNGSAIPEFTSTFIAETYYPLNNAPIPIPHASISIDDQQQQHT